MPVLDAPTYDISDLLSERDDLAESRVLVVIGERPVQTVMKTLNQKAGGDSGPSGMVEGNWVFDLGQTSIEEITRTLCTFFAPNYFNKNSLVSEKRAVPGSADIISMPFTREAANIQGSIDLHYFQSGSQPEPTRSLFLSTVEGQDSTELQAMRDFLRNLRQPPVIAPAVQKPLIRGL